MQIPVIKLDTCQHIGELDITKKGQQGDSLEGHLLSISQCPLAWRQIVKLGGYPVHQLEKDDALFLAIHKISPELKTHIIEYGLQNNLIERTERYRGWSYDDVDDRWYYSDYKTAQDAFYEVDNLGEYEAPEDVPGPDGHSGIELVEIYAGTCHLAEVVKTPSSVGRDAFDYLVIAWAEQFAHLDGIWWEDTYDPYGYSAPRGGIFPDRLWSWSIQEIPAAHLVDNEDPQPVQYLEMPQLQKSHLAVAPCDHNLTA